MGLKKGDKVWFIVPLRNEAMADVTYMKREMEIATPIISCGKFLRREQFNPRVEVVLGNRVFENKAEMEFLKSFCRMEVIKQGKLQSICEITLFEVYTDPASLLLDIVKEIIND